MRSVIRSIGKVEHSFLWELTTKWLSKIWTILNLEKRVAEYLLKTPYTAEILAFVSHQIAPTLSLSKPKESVFIKPKGPCSRKWCLPCFWLRFIIQTPLNFLPADMRVYAMLGLTWLLIYEGTTQWIEDGGMCVEVATWRINRPGTYRKVLHFPPKIFAKVWLPPTYTPIMATNIERFYIV